MIVAFKENNSFSFAYVPDYVPMNGIERSNYLSKENIPIKHADGFTILATDPAIEFEIIKANTKYLKGTLNPRDMLDDIDTIKDLLSKYCLINKDGQIGPGLIIAKDDRAYRITDDFNCYEISDMAIIESEAGLHNYFISFIDMEEGSPRERIIKALKKVSMYQLRREATIVIMNSNDDNIEIY